MEVMEEGNLMDRIPILLQRDMQYYQQNQVVLQETICPGVVGGRLDFPRYASFASVKIVKWFEDEFFAAYKKNSGLLHIDHFKEGNENEMQETGNEGANVVKNSDPTKFVSLITKSSDKLLEHIHTLSQEALDHADLSVLTATIGASALLKNALWVYLQNVSVNMCPPKGDEKGGSLKISHKQYSEMTEALAERLLDLHCRLLTLYILQDADSLNWTSQKSFFESERGSYTIQMWWLYLQGTREDLWNSVPPKMAQRVFSGMLNETLTVLAVRYTQAVPSQARSQLLLVDLCNILLCMAELIPFVCESGEALVGLNMKNQSKSIRDIHAKCHELFCCLLFRGAPLGVLYKVLKKSSKSMFNSFENSPCPWTMFAFPKLFPGHQNESIVSRCSDFNTNTAICIELLVLFNAPQADWALLLKCLLMRDTKLSTLIFHHLMQNIPSDDNFVETLKQPLMNSKSFKKKCEGFLCGMECTNVALWTLSNTTNPVEQTNYQVILALCYILITAGKPNDIQRTLIDYLERLPDKNWTNYLDRRQVWNQKRAPWLEAIMYLIYPILDPIVHMLLSAVQTGNATMYQAMSLAISCFSEMWDCLPDCVYKVTHALMEILPTDIKPLGDFVLIQMLFSALYTKLLEAIVIETDSEKENGSTSAGSDKIGIYQQLAEAICSVDEDNKHTDQLNKLLEQAKESQLKYLALESEFNETLGLSLVSTVKMDDLEATTPDMNLVNEELDVENADYISEILTSDILATNVGKQAVKIIFNYFKNNIDWIFYKLNFYESLYKESRQLPGQNLEEHTTTLLHKMFHIGNQQFDPLLTDNIRVDYNKWLQMPLSISQERAWLQISKRHEFQENVKLNLHDTAMVAYITSQFKDNL